MASVSRWPSRRRRVVVTGLGVVSSLASDVRQLWPNLINGKKTGIKRLTNPELQHLPCRVAGAISVGDAEDQLNSKFLDSAVLRQLGLASMYGLVAAQEALNDAKWASYVDEKSKKYTGVAIGRVFSDLGAIGDASAMIANKEYKSIPPHTAIRAMCNGSAWLVGEKFGFTGPQFAPLTACAAGGHAIIASYQAILLGDAKVMVCGGTDAALQPIQLSIYSKIGVLATKYNETPELASRPFDKERDGFVVSDGAAILVLEELEHALARGAKIHAEVLGYGMCRDTGTVSAAELSGLGIQDSMTRALENSSLDAQDVGYVNAHATSTKTGDPAEARGNIRTFGPDSVYVASNKGALGHMQGAAGAVEALSSVLSCRDGVIPPTVNLADPEVEGVNYVIGKAVKWTGERRIALSNSFGFGGACGSVIFSNYTG